MFLCLECDGNRSDFWPAMEIRNRDRKNREIFRCTQLLENRPRPPRLRERCWIFSSETATAFLSLSELDGLAICANRSARIEQCQVVVFNKSRTIFLVIFLNHNEYMYCNFRFFQQSMSLKTIPSKFGGWGFHPPESGVYAWKKL